MDTKHTNSSVADVKVNLDAVRVESNGIRSDIAANLASYQETLASELATFRTEITANKTRIDSVVSEFQSLFSTAQESRQNEFGTMKEGWKTEFTEWHSKIEADRESLEETSQAATSKILAEMNSRKNEIEKLVGIIGNLGMTSGFQKVAMLKERSCLLFISDGLHYVTLNH